MLSNAYFLAKFRFDTAENEPVKFLQNFAKFANFADPNPLTLREAGDEELKRAAVRKEEVERESSSVLVSDMDCTERFAASARRLSDLAARSICSLRKCILVFRHEYAFFESLPIFGKCWRARSRQYRSRLLRVKIRSAAFFKTYKSCALLHRSKF